jgi:hypothetical protein
VYVVSTENMPEVTDIKVYVVISRNKHQQWFYK